MALTAQALTTYSVVRDLLGLTSSVDNTATQTNIERAIDAVSAAIAQVANRIFQYSAGIVERVAGFGTTKIRVIRMPIRSIAAVEIIASDGTVAFTYPLTSFEIVGDGKSGMIQATDGGGFSGVECGVFPWTAIPSDSIRGRPLPGSERRSLQVVYDAGFITPEQARANTGMLRDLPYDLEEATIQSAISVYRNRARDRTITSQTVHEASTSWSQPAEGNMIIGTEASGILTTNAMQVAKRYRRVA